jgi:hypothetical protein
VRPDLGPERLPGAGQARAAEGERHRAHDGQLREDRQEGEEEHDGVGVQCGLRRGVPGTLPAGSVRPGSLDRASAPGGGGSPGA